jgi:hypothetical protein
MERFYYWETENAHSDNTETLNDFIEYHLADVLPNYEVTYDDDSYCVVAKGSDEYEIHASRNGDSTHHKVEIIHIT